MALPPEVIGQRIRAARELNGLSQNDLAARLVEQGLGKTDAGRLERGELVMQSVHRSALAEALNVPLGWFVLEREELLKGIARSFLTGVALPDRALDTPSLEAIEELIDRRMAHFDQVTQELADALAQRQDLTRDQVSATRSVAGALKDQAADDESEQSADADTRGGAGANPADAPIPREARR